MSGGFKKKLLPTIPAESNIVMDNASYRSTQVDKVLTLANRKDELISCLQRHSISCTTDLRKAELLHLVKIQADRQETTGIN
jgi:hypothetical protein